MGGRSNIYQACELPKPRHRGWIPHVYKSNLSDNPQTHNFDNYKKVLNKSKANQAIRQKKKGRAKNKSKNGPNEDIAIKEAIHKKCDLIITYQNLR